MTGERARHGSPMPDPARNNHSSRHPEQAICDVVVVGGGGAGLAAAIEVAERGGHAVLLEKNPSLGGSTAWSVGSISATRTSHQDDAGIVDHPDDHYEDMEVLAGSYANRDNRELRRILVDRTTEMMQWLEQSGLVFVGPNVEPPHRQPRMHNVVPNSRSFPYHLGRRALAAGVDVRLNAKVERLISDHGSITGLTYHDGRQSHVLKARGGVVLAAGDYSGSRELKAEFAGPDVSDLEPVNITATGDGFRLALEHGAEMVNGDIVRGPIMRFVPPEQPNLIGRLPPWTALAKLMKWSFDHLPQAILRPFAMSFLTTALGPSVDLFKQGAILINQNGQRFVDEINKPGMAVPHQPERLAYIVMDAKLARQFTAWPYFISTAPGVAYAYLDDYRRNRADIFIKADSVGELAGKLGMDTSVLQQTIGQYNRQDRKTRNGSFPALDQGPYIALGPVRSYVVFTDGGLKVSLQHEVLHSSGAPIDGLYAAGSNGQGGVLLEGHGHHLAWAFISGRRAGEQALARARQHSPKQG